MEPRSVVHGAYISALTLLTYLHQAPKVRRPGATINIAPCPGLQLIDSDPVLVANTKAIGA